MINDNKNPEIWSSSFVLNQMTTTSSPYMQRIYSKAADYVVNLDDIFIYPLKKDTTNGFIHFTGENLPPGMGFNLDSVQLEWKPVISQLGYHEFSYVLELREKGELEMAIEKNEKDSIKWMRNKLKII